jgi:hypothetical protein
MNARNRILLALMEDWPLPVHKFRIRSHSQNTLATEVSEMARDGLVTGSFVEGKRYKAWNLTVLGIDRAQDLQGR